MESLIQILGGLGFLGIIAGVVLAAAVFFVLPWLAIVECIRSHRGSNAKTFLVIGLVLTWGFGSIFYGLFVTSSRALRIFTVFAVVAPILILVPSFISVGTSARIGSQIQGERERAEVEELLSKFTPGKIPDDALEPFVAIHFLHDDSGPRSAALARFTLGGPDFSSARDIDKSVKHVVADNNERYFALTSHDFGTITPSTGRFTKVEVDPSLGNFSWPKGVAIDTKTQQVIIMTSHVHNHFYTYDPRTSDWRHLPSETRDLPLVGLTYLPADDCLYALERRSGQPALERIHRFNASGASLGSVELDPAIPLGRTASGPFQLHGIADKLVVLLPPFGDGNDGAPDLDSGGNRILVVDPVSGAVAEPLAARTEGTASG